MWVYNKPRMFAFRRSFYEVFLCPCLLAPVGAPLRKLEPERRSDASLQLISYIFLKIEGDTAFSFMKYLYLNSNTSLYLGSCTEDIYSIWDYFFYFFLMMMILTLFFFNFAGMWSKSCNVTQTILCTVTAGLQCWHYVILIQGTEVILLCVFYINVCIVLLAGVSRRIRL